MKRGLVARLCLFAFVGAGLVLWRGAGGWFATERTLSWALPVAAADVREVELQVWDDEGLIRAETRALPRGLDEALESKAVLSRGPKRAVAIVRLARGSARVAFTGHFDPASETHVPIELLRAPGAEPPDSTSQK